MLVVNVPVLSEQMTEVQPRVSTDGKDLKIGDNFIKGGFKSENVEGFSNLPKNIPKNYLKFVHPLHDIDKTSILNFFDFTSYIYLQVIQKDF